MGRLELPLPIVDADAFGWLATTVRRGSLIFVAIVALKKAQAHISLTRFLWSALYFTHLFYRILYH